MSAVVRIPTQLRTITGGTEVEVGNGGVFHGGRRPRRPDGVSLASRRSLSHSSW